MSSQYSDIKNTALSISNLIKPVTSIVLSGRDVSISAIDTTLGNVNLLLTQSQWNQAVLSTLVIENVSGANQINLLSVDSTDPNIRAAAIQVALGLNVAGATVILNIIRYGAGSASITVDGSEVVQSSSSYGSAILQAVNVSPGSEANVITTTTNFVTIDTVQSINSTKTFTVSPFMSQIRNGTGFLNMNSSGIISIPNDTDILIGRDTSDILSNKLLQSSSVLFIDSGATKRLTFDTSLNALNTTGTFVTQFTSNKSIIFPDTNDTIVTLNEIQTLNNKTLGSPVLSDPTVIKGINTISFPDITDILVTRNTVDSLTNKTIDISTCTLADVSAPGDGSRFLSFDTSSNDSSIGGTIRTQFTTSSKILTLPDVTDTLVSETFPQTLTNKTIDDPVLISNSNTILLPTSAGTLALRSDIVDPTNFVTLNTPQTITGTKTFTVSPISPGISDGTFSVGLPLLGGSDTFVLLNSAQTMTNKTLTLPTISSISNEGTILIPTTSGTLALVSQIPDSASFVDITTDQTINGTKTFNTPPIMDVISRSSFDLIVPTLSGDDVLLARNTLETITQKSLDAATIQFSSDTDKRMQFSLESMANSSTLTLAGTSQSTQTIFLPDASSDTLVGRSTIDTLANKTLTLPTISSIYNTGTLTLPTTTDTLLGRDGQATVTNKLLVATSVFIVDDLDTTKQIIFDPSALPTTSTLLLSAPTSSAIVSFPNVASDTLMSRTSTDIVTNKDLTDASNTFPSTLVTLDGNQTLTNKTLQSPIITNGGTITLPTTTDILLARDTPSNVSNKNLITTSVVFQDDVDSSKTLAFNISSFTPSTRRTISVPNVTDTMVTADFTQTLTNKTLTNPFIENIRVGAATISLPTADGTLILSSQAVTLTDNQTITGQKTFSLAPVISTITNNSNTLTLPTSTDTIVGRATVDTLTNKTLTLPTISSIRNTGTLTLPTSTDTIVGRATVDTLTNKTLTLPTISSIRNTGTLTLPTSTDTIVGRDTIDILTNKTLTLPTISSIRNTGTLTLPTSTDTLIGRDTIDILTNKTLISPEFADVINAGSTLTLPTSTDTLVGRDTVDVLSNKTLSLPIISVINNNGTSLTLPTVTDTIVGRITADTLTNKTLTLPTISSIYNTGTITVPTTSGTLALRGETVNLTGDQTVNGNKTFSSPLILQNTDVSISSTTGSLRCAGGIYAGASSLYGSNAVVSIQRTEASSTSNTGALRCSGGIYVGNNSLINARLTMGDSIRLAAGGDSFPSLTFLADTDSGMYSGGDGIVGFSSNANMRFQYSPTSIDFIDGGAGVFTIGSQNQDPIANSVFGVACGTGVGNSFNINGINPSAATLKVGRTTDGDVCRFYRSGEMFKGNIGVTSGGVTYNSVSDRRLKTNVRDMSGYIDIIRKLNVYEYEFIENIGKKEIGFIADEVKKILPYVVSGEENKVDENGNIVPMGMDYGRMSPIAIGAIKELLKQIEDLKQRVSVLENQVISNDVSN